MHFKSNEYEKEIFFNNTIDVCHNWIWANATGTFKQRK